MTRVVLFGATGATLLVFYLAHGADGLRFLLSGAGVAQIVGYLWVVALAAGASPAWSAANVDPMEALRAE